jgi:hypothetical protein
LKGIKKKKIDTNGEEKKHITFQMNEVIEEIGVENVAQVVTNNDASWKHACQIIEAKIPHVVYRGCILHVLDLIFKKIRKWDWVNKIKGT